MSQVGDDTVSMEGVMRPFWAFILITSFSFFSLAGEKELARLYFQRPFGHLHQNASKESKSKTIVQCAHSVKVLKVKTEITGWTYAMVGDEKGYIQSHFLDSKRPLCFQERYSRFYSKMRLDITDMYYWGRLYDQYLEGRSRAR